MKRRTKTSSKVVAQEKQILRQEKNLFNQLVSVLNSEKVQMSPHQMNTLASHLKQKSSSSIDVGYIRTVLFPELYSYDIPQPLSNISFSRFTDKQEATISTGTDGSNGAGMMLWFPKVNYGPSLFVYQASGASLDSALPIAFADRTGTKTLSPTWKLGFIQNYVESFQQTCLVAASISIQYVGQLQSESGYFVGGQVFSQGVNQIIVDDVENAQFRVLAKPGEGVRLLYLPKDATDYTYYPVKAGTSHNTGNPNANEDQFILDKDVTYTSVSAPNATTGSTYKPPFDISYLNNNSCLAIYWKGLPASNNVIRIDATRKFNGIPTSKVRDILDVSRPKRQYDAKKTTDVIGQLISSVPQLGGHTIKQMDHVSDQIQTFLPNIGHLYSSGYLREGLTLQGFSQGLALQQAGLNGPITNTGRIWDTE